MSYQGRQTLTVIGTAFPADKAPKIGDPIDVTVPWTGRGVTTTVVELEMDGDGVVRWRAQASLDLNQESGSFPEDKPGSQPAARESRASNTDKQPS